LKCQEHVCRTPDDPIGPIGPHNPSEGATTISLTLRIEEAAATARGGKCQEVVVPPYFFWIYRDRELKWRWRLYAWENRRILADSGESFSSLQSCERNIDLVKRVAPTAPIRYHESARR
jgi:uncharacterized protein YegP (UPF0339 family)